MSAYRFDVERLKSSRPADAVLVSVTILLTGIGLVTLFSASSAFAERFFGDGAYFIRKQAIFGIVALPAMLIVSSLDLEFVRRWVKPLVLGSLLLCFLALMPGIGMTKNGASRWIRLGPFSYQPSELVKLALPIYLAHLFSKNSDRLEDASSSVLPPAIVSALFCGLIYLQNNFSTSTFLAFNALALFFIAGVKFRHFALTALIALPVGFLSVFTKEHRVARLMTYLSPESDPLGAGYQVRASIDTFLSGGFWGKGLGRGTRKIASVPEVHSDFVFSAYGEEFGFFGVLLCFVLFVLFAVRGYRAALRSEDQFKRLLGFGLTTMIASQALLNLAVVIGALPATGVPLPFFSAGGSSFATTLVMAGMLINISRNPIGQEGSYVG